VAIPSPADRLGWWWQPIKHRVWGLWQDLEITIQVSTPNEHIPAAVATLGAAAADVAVAATAVSLPVNFFMRLVLCYVELPNERQELRHVMESVIAFGLDCGMRSKSICSNRGLSVFALQFRCRSFTFIPSFRQHEQDASKLSPKSMRFLDHNLDVILRHAQKDGLCQQCQSPSEVQEILSAEYVRVEYASPFLISVRPPTSTLHPSKSVFFGFWPEKKEEAAGNFCLNFLGFTSLDKHHKEKDTAKYIDTIFFQ
jgi:hypothetical protein